MGETPNKKKRKLSDLTPEERARYLERKRLRELRLKKQKQKRMMIFAGVAIAVLLVIFLLVSGISALVRSTSNKKAEKLAAEQAALEAEMVEEEPVDLGRFPEPVSIKVTVVGDCTIGLDSANFDYETSVCQYYDDYGPEYFMQNVRSIFEEDDLTIANLECTLTEATTRNENHTYCFKAPTSYTSILTSSSIEAVTTANNHSQDYLDDGYRDTLKALDDAGIINFGYQKTAMTEIKGVKIGMVGTYEIIEHEGIVTELRDNIKKLQEDGADIIIVIFHWGNELDLMPDATQTYLAHAAVDAGADLVCGHHAHVIQGSEVYKGKNILYGLANFCFGGNTYPTDMDTIIYQQTFTMTNDGLKDDLVTNIIPARVSSDYYFNNYQPTPAEGDEATRIMNKYKERCSWLTSNTAPANNTNSESEESTYDDSDYYDYSEDEDYSDYDQ